MPKEDRATDDENRTNLRCRRASLAAIFLSANG